MSGGLGQRNVLMAERIERAPVGYPVRLVVAGDSGAWPDPTADGIFAALVSQIGALDPPPVFFANLGDFAGPGTVARHEHYLGLVEPLTIPNICVVGNHDLDDESGSDTFARIHGPANFDFAYGHTRFVAIHAQPGIAGVVEVPGAGTPEGTEGPRDEDLAFLEGSLGPADEPHRVVLMHMPPHLDGHFAPHADWGFTRREREFLALLRGHDVKLVCCAHCLAFDEHVRDGIRFVMSGGGGSGLCSHFRGICTEGVGASRRPRQPVPRRRDHDLRGRGDLRPRHPGVRPSRSDRAALRRRLPLARGKRQPEACEQEHRGERDADRPFGQAHRELASDQDPRDRADGEPAGGGEV
ncbi:MAG: metallophosphoesterase family protein, partial [Candidatus Limnocylindria bacterium]